MTRTAPIVLTLLVALLSGCVRSEKPSGSAPTQEGSPTIAQPERHAPPGAAALITDRSDVVSIRCARSGAGEPTHSDARDFIDDILREYPAVDFAAPAFAACVVGLESGATLDLLRIQQRWAKFRRPEAKETVEEAARTPTPDQAASGSASSERLKRCSIISINTSEGGITAELPCGANVAPLGNLSDRFVQYGGQRCLELEYGLAGEDRRERRAFCPGADPKGELIGIAVE